MTLDQAFGSGIRNDASQQRDGADGVVVARNRVLNVVWVAVRVENSDDRDAELVCLVDGEVLFLGVDNPDRRRRLRQVANTTEALLQLDQLALLNEQFFLGETARRVVEVDFFELLHACEALRNRLEVREQTAEPALVDERLADALSLLGDRTLCLLLGANEEDGAAVGNGVLDVVIGLVDVRERLLEVNDVAAASFRENEALHLWVPATGLVPEVHAAVEQLANGYNGHGRFSFLAGISRPSVVFRCRTARNLVLGGHPPSLSHETKTGTGGCVPV